MHGISFRKAKPIAKVGTESHGSEWDSRVAFLLRRERPAFSYFRKWFCCQGSVNKTGGENKTRTRRGRVKKRKASEDISNTHLLKGGLT
jgi:hypothetical protein